MKKKQKNTGSIFLIGAIVFALLAAGLTALLLQAFTAMTDVVMVNTDIDPYEQIESDHLRVVEINETAVPDDAVVDPGQIVGQYAQVGLIDGTVLRQRHFATEISGGTLSYELTQSEDEEMRAMAIPDSRILTIGGKLSRNDRIDMVCAREDKDTGDEYSKLFLRDIRVLDVVEGAIIVSVTPRQAETIVWVLIDGDIYALLNPYDADPDDALTPSIYGSETFYMDFLMPQLPDDADDMFEDMFEDFEQEEEEED